MGTVKRMVLVPILTAALLSGASLSLAADDVKASGQVIEDGHLLGGEASPVIHDGKVYAPLRAVFESLGWTVIWYADGQTITAEKKGAQPGFFKTSIGYNQAAFNGDMRQTDPPILQNNQTYVAISALQQLGIKTTWNESTLDLVVVSTPIPHTFEYADGRRYEGEIQNGLPNGKGLLFSKDRRLIYDGQFSSGLINGVGKLFDEQSKLLYAGEFSYERKQGYGRLYREDGTLSFDGQFEDGKQTSSGRSYDIDGTKWAADPSDPSGSRGTIVYPNGARFFGSFRDGAADGYGRLTAMDGTPIVEGEFMKGSLNQNGITVKVVKERYYTLSTRSTNAKAYSSPAHGLTVPFPNEWLGIPVEVTEGPNKISFSYINTKSEQVPFLAIKIYDDTQWNEKNSTLPDGALKFREQGGVIYGFVSLAKSNPYEEKVSADTDSADFAKLAAGIDKALKFTELSTTKLALTEELLKGTETDIWRRFAGIEQWTLKMAGAFDQFLLSEHDRKLIISQLQQVYSPVMAESLFNRQNKQVEGGWQSIPIDYVSISHIGGEELGVKIQERENMRTVIISGHDVEVLYNVDSATNKISGYDIIRYSY